LSSTTSTLCGTVLAGDGGGGTLHAASEGLGKGSAFTLGLPLFTGPVAAPVVPPPPSPAKTVPHRVLVVDDNPDAALSLADALEEVGYTVRVAHDGPAALDSLGEFHPDVALLDIGLPVMDGYELAQRLRALLGLASPKLIAITGYGQDGDRQKAWIAGFAEHLVKPVDIQQVQDAIERVFAEPARPGDA
jgi:CheY-like chemotaxis protein